MSRNEVFDLPADWKFCITRAQLSELATTPDFGYDYQYALPNRCRRVLSMVDEDGDDVQYKWRRECAVTVSGSEEYEWDVILTDEDECRVKYIRLREDVGAYPGWFVNLIILNLAIKLSEPLKQDKKKRQQLEFAMERAWNLAVSTNALEDCDVNKDGINIDLGNNDVLNAAPDAEVVSQKYIVER